MTLEQLVHRSLCGGFAFDKEVVFADLVVALACGTVLEDHSVELDVIETLGVDA